MFGAGRRPGDEQGGSARRENFIGGIIARHSHDPIGTHKKRHKIAHPFDKLHILAVRNHAEQCFALLVRHQRARHDQATHVRGHRSGGEMAGERKAVLSATHRTQDSLAHIRIDTLRRHAAGRRPEGIEIAGVAGDGFQLGGEIINVRRGVYGRIAIDPDRIIKPGDRAEVPAALPFAADRFGIVQYVAQTEHTMRVPIAPHPFKRWQ